jgi:hypothetical protein
MPFIAIAIAAVLAIGGGASVAANSSLPGDALYPFKIGVNEKVESALSFSDEARAEENLEAIAERRSEAEKLRAEGKLDAKAEASLNANIDAHAAAFANALAKVKANGSAQAVANLEAKLQAALDAAVSANASAGANANANMNSNSRGSATGTANSSSASSQDDDGTPDQGHGDAESHGGIKVDL